MRFFQKALIILLASFFIFGVFGCSGETGKTSYDGKTYDISASGNGSATLSLKKVGNGYAIKVSGRGSVVDFAQKDKVPWNVILKKVASITIEEGITNIGDYYFFGTNINEFILPSSVGSVGQHSFSSDAILYSYADAEFDTDYTIYYYSAEKPFVMNKYFRIVDGVPKVWRDYSILFIGNSFTYYPSQNLENPTVPYFFGKLAESFGETVYVDFVVKGSHTLTKYANPTDEKGAIVEQKLTTNKYDFIVLQEQSTTPINNYNTFYAAVGKLVNRIAETQNNAQVFLYETWGSPTAIEGTTYKTVAEMTEALAQAYDKCAEGYGIKVNRIGDAFSYVYSNYQNIGIYYSDNRHQNKLGAYLSACCHIASILDLDVRKSEFYDDIEQSVCRILQETAYAVSFVR